MIFTKNLVSQKFEDKNNLNRYQVPIQMRFSPSTQPYLNVTVTRSVYTNRTQIIVKKDNLTL